MFQPWKWSVNGLATQLPGNSVKSRPRLSFEEQKPLTICINKPFYIFCSSHQLTPFLAFYVPFFSPRVFLQLNDWEAANIFALFLWAAMALNNMYTLKKKVLVKQILYIKIKILLFIHIWFWNKSRKKMYILI